jgi:hypothetical protein
MGKNSRSGSGMNIPDLISEILETIFGLKILQFFDADPESFLPWIRDGNIWNFLTVLRIRDVYPISAALLKNINLSSTATQRNFIICFLFCADLIGICLWIWICDFLVADVSDWHRIPCLIVLDPRVRNPQF